MRPEHHEESGGDGLLVPMAWMYSEYIADEVLATGDLMEPTTLEYRAGRDALALTIFLSDGAAAEELPVARVDELRLLTAYGASWRHWVCARLEALERPTAPAGPRIPTSRSRGPCGGGWRRPSSWPRTSTRSARRRGTRRATTRARSRCGPRPGSWDYRWDTWPSISTEASAPHEPCTPARYLGSRRVIFMPAPTPVSMTSP